MKKIILTFCLLILVGCGASDASNPIACYNSVTKAYPGSEVVAVPGKSFIFMVRKPNGAIVYVETMSSMDTRVTTAFTAFDAK